MSQAILDIIKTNSGKNIVSIPEDYWDWLNLHLTMYIDFKRDHLNGADEEEREFLEHDSDDDGQLFKVDGMRIGLNNTCVEHMMRIERMV